MITFFNCQRDFTHSSGGAQVCTTASIFEKKILALNERKLWRKNTAFSGGGEAPPGSTFFCWTVGGLSGYTKVVRTLVGGHGW